MSTRREQVVAALKRRGFSRDETLPRGTLAAIAEELGCSVPAVYSALTNARVDAIIARSKAAQP